MKRCQSRMKSVWWAGVLAVGAGVLGHAWAAQAQPAPPPPPPQPKVHYGAGQIPFELELNLAKAYASPLGQMVMGMVRAENPNADEMLDGLSESLGLDPRTDIGSIRVVGEAPAHPAPGTVPRMTLVAELGDSSGNLSGFMLGLPGYQSQELAGGVLLHSFETQPPHPGHGAPGAHGPHAGGDPAGHEAPPAVAPPPPPAPPQRIFAAMPTGPDGRVRLIASTQRDDVVSRTLGQGVPQPDTLATPRLQGEQILALRVPRLPETVVPAGAPGSAILESVRGLSLAVGSGDDFSIDLAMTTASAARSRQVAMALGQLAAIENPEMQPLTEMLGSVRISTQNGDEPGVTASFRGTQAQVEQWIQRLKDAQ